MNNVWLKTLQKFFLVNACVLLPLWWIGFGWMPDQVKVRMRGWEEAPGSIMANGAALAGEEYGEWSGGRVFRFYLRTGMVWKDLVFRFPGATGPEAVERVELQKWKLLSLCKRGNGLEERDPGTAEYVFANPRFDSVGLAGGKVAWALAVLEVLLAALSWWCARRHREEAWKNLLPPTIAVALTLVLLTQVALPIQSFWANRASYAFSFGELMGEVALRFAWMSALGIVAVALLARCFGRWVFGVAFALAVCIYLESGILSNGLAHLNGDIFLLQDRMRALWDATVWVTVFVVILAAHPLLRNHYALSSLCLAVMVGASLFDTKHEQLADKSNLIVHDFVPIDTVIRSVTYSTNRNVMVFILDSLEREQAHAIMEDPEAGPKLREQFRGFTEFTNNVGALPLTVFAVPNLLTGRYPDGTTSIADYSWSCYGDDSALAEFLATEHDIFMATPEFGCGYASRTSGSLATSRALMPVMDCPGNSGDAWSVRNFTRWRYLPFAAKATVSSLISIANDPRTLREWIVFPQLNQAEISFASPGMFLWCHTIGVHQPICFNRHGEIVPADDNNEQACVEQAVFIFKTLGTLLDFYRKIGIFDNSLILVLGDHGDHNERRFLQDQNEGRLPGNARPCLWVKPMGSTNDFMTCGLATSHAQISALLKSAAQRKLSEKDISNILQSGKRVYRRMAVWGRGWTDWVVDGDGSFTIEKHHIALTDARNIRPVECGIRYPLNYAQQKRDVSADISFQNVGIIGYPYLPQGIHKASFEFRVPNAEKRYVLRVELFDAEGGSLRFRSDVPGAEWEEFPVRPHGEIVVHGVQADESGIARILFERAAGPDIDVAFTSLMLEE